jgi:hypothetical protein
MSDGLGLNYLFDSVQCGIQIGPVRAEIKPTQSDIDHAVASIREWRAYLPPPCVAAMIRDGWQWST